ncbi:MAG: hypothetical protein R3F35_08890 [Myxococcota bacterium]
MTPIASFGWLVAGCGPEERDVSSSSRYRGPAEYRVRSARIVDAPFDEVWRSLVGHLDDASLRVVTMDARSRFIVVELRASSDASSESPHPTAGAPPLEQPSRYVDCGQASGSLELDGAPERFESALADAGRARELRSAGEDWTLHTLERRTDLTALATLYLQPERRRTRVSTNARYALTLERTIWTQRVPRSRRDALGPEQETSVERETIRLTSLEPGRLPGFEGGSCRSTGRFERLVLDRAAALSGVTPPLRRPE